MFGNRTRSSEEREHLAAQIERIYGLQAVHLTPTERGWYGETWRVDHRQGRLFAKLVTYPPQQEHYRRSFSVLEYLRAKDMRDISRVVLACNGALWAELTEGTLGLFHWVEGLHTEEYPLDQLFTRLCALYRVPTKGAPGMPREDYTMPYIDSVRSMALQADAPIRAVLASHRDRLTAYAARLRAFAARCQTDPGYLHITTGDVGGNVIMQGTRMFIIDWDRPKLAPIERDLWFYMRLDSQLRQIDQVLAREGLPDRLSPQRLAYYAYHRYFFYLQEYLGAYAALPDQRDDVLDALENFFSRGYWVNEAMARADRLEPEEEGRPWI